MKKIYSIIALSGLLALSSCNLDMSPVDYNSAGNFWTSEAKVQTFYNGLLSYLRADYTSPCILGEFRGGTIKYGSSIEGVGLNYGGLAHNDPIDADNPQISNWNGYYSRILQVNDMIDREPAGPGLWPPRLLLLHAVPHLRRRSAGDHGESRLRQGGRE